MPNTITIQLSKSEAWAVLNALAEMNRNAPARPARGEALEPQMRTWIADRILRELGEPATAA